MSSTTEGSASVDTSPNSLCWLEPIFLKMRRMIFPERVLGRPGTICVCYNKQTFIIILSLNQVPINLRTAPTGTTKTPSFTVKREHSFVRLFPTFHAVFDSLQYAEWKGHMYYNQVLDDGN